MIRRYMSVLLPRAALALALFGTITMSTISGARAQGVTNPGVVPPTPALTRALQSKDNYCNYFLDKEASIAYDEAAIKKLLETKRECPTGVTLDKTLEYVDKLLYGAFDEPYTAVIPPDVAKAMQEQFSGKRQAFDGGGIGAVLSIDPTKRLPAKAAAQPADDATQDGGAAAAGNAQPLPFAFTGLVFHVVRDSPAAKAGLRDGDIITAVNGTPVIGLYQDEVVEKYLRGPLNSKVVLTIKRGNGKPFTRTLTRAKVIPDNVWSRDLGHGIYAIVITGFDRQNTAGLILTELEQIGKKARGYIFDVRGNPGGLMDEAIMAAAFVVHDGVIVSQRERIPGDPAKPEYYKITWTRKGGVLINETVVESTGEVIEHRELKLATQKLDSKTGKPVGKVLERDFPLATRGKPVVVIANGGSASASEIFTGALQENLIEGDGAQGGVFVGEQSFGKFIGQALIPGPQGTLIRATTFRYFSPTGKWLGDAHKNRIGLTPDKAVKQPDTAIPYTASDAQLNAAVDLIVEKLGRRHR